MDDAIAIAPEIHKLEFENSIFRVLKVRIKPGERALMHWHPKNVSYVLTPGTLKFTSPEGISKEVQLKKGQITFGEGSHIVENIGNTNVVALQVELQTEVNQ